MARFLTVLALAHGATALLDGYVDVLVRLEMHVSLGGMLDAIGDGMDECSSVQSALSSCYFGPRATGPVDACYCCQAEKPPVSAAWASCASFVDGTMSPNDKPASSGMFDCPGTSRAYLPLISDSDPRTFV